MESDEHFFRHISNSTQFNEKCLEIFRYQYQNNTVYRTFCNHLKTGIDLTSVSDIPFLPIEFFKTETVLCGYKSEKTFESSGTGGQTSQHHVRSLAMYEASFRLSFELFYGKPDTYAFCCLLPSYLERSGSSLIYMAQDLIDRSPYPESGFFLDNLSALKNTLERLRSQRIPTVLLGVSFALLDFVDSFSIDFPGLIVMETGGMKGRKEEITREDLHNRLKAGFGVESIHSEYGMTELLSQAYSKGNGIFNTPPWMQIVIRDTTDPRHFLPNGISGAISIIDLANIHSCSFLATSDLGKKHSANEFEVLGRVDNSDIRGCNLMVSSL